MREFSNKVIRKINCTCHKCIFYFTTIFCRLSAWLAGVDFYGKVVFRGWTSFFRASNSIIRIGHNCSFNSSGYSNHIGLNHRCIISTMVAGAKIRIGDGTGMSSTTVSSWISVDIGNNVRIGANSVIMDGDFHLDDCRTPSPRPITICDNVWLGANVVVMKGVRIGENTIIGTNSIVTRDIPANCVAAGNPCRVIKELNNVNN